MSVQEDAHHSIRNTVIIAILYTMLGVINLVPAIGHLEAAFSCCGKTLMVTVLGIVNLPFLLMYPFNFSYYLIVTGFTELVGGWIVQKLWGLGKRRAVAILLLINSGAMLVWWISFWFSADSYY